ncbi:hypothetical protein PIB30_031068 [Stylosanthes scabra]|nr:hypothetical protein [Stylosanthes scabra]
MRFFSHGKLEMTKVIPPSFNLTLSHSISLPLPVAALPSHRRSPPLPVVAFPSHIATSSLALRSLSLTRRRAAPLNRVAVIFSSSLSATLCK